MDGFFFSQNKKTLTPENNWKFNFGLFQRLLGMDTPTLLCFVLWGGGCSRIWWFS